MGSIQYNIPNENAVDSFNSYATVCMPKGVNFDLTFRQTVVYQVFTMLISVTLALYKITQGLYYIGLFSGMSGFIQEKWMHKDRPISCLVVKQIRNEWPIGKLTTFCTYR